MNHFASQLSLCRSSRFCNIKVKGFSLLLSLFMLVILSILMVAMMRSTTLQLTMSGNIREKARALRVAQSTINYAEWFTRQNQNPAVSCGAGQLSLPQICDSAVAIDNSNDPPLSTWTEYQPSSNTDYWNTSNSGGKDAFYRNPGYYIQYLYSTPDGMTDYYKITAFGYGGNNQAQAITQSIFQIARSGSLVTNLGR